MIQDTNGTVTACAPGTSSRYPQAEELSVTCAGQQGELRVVFPDRELSGTYQETESNRTGKLYQIHLADWGQGYGVCSYTEHATGQRLPTLVMTFPEKATFTFTGQAKAT